MAARPPWAVRQVPSEQRVDSDSMVVYGHSTELGQTPHGSRKWGQQGPGPNHSQARVARTAAWPISGMSPSWSASLPNVSPPAREDHGSVSAPLLSWIMSVFVELPQSLVVFKDSFSRALLPALLSSCPLNLLPDSCFWAQSGQGGPRLPWHTKPSILKNAAYESADCGWDKGTFRVVGTLAFPLTSGLACSHCLRVLGAIARVVVKSFTFWLDLKDYKCAAFAHMPFLMLVGHPALCVSHPPRVS